MRLPRISHANHFPAAGKMVALPALTAPLPAGKRVRPPEPPPTARFGLFAGKSQGGGVWHEVGGKWAANRIRAAEHPGTASPKRHRRQARRGPGPVPPIRRWPGQRAGGLWGRFSISWWLGWVGLRGKGSQSGGFQPFCLPAGPGGWLSRAARPPGRVMPIGPTATGRNQVEDQRAASCSKVGATAPGRASVA